MGNIIEITDFSAPELDMYARLSEAQLLHYYEPNGGLFIAESPKVIERALDAGCRPVSLLLERKDIEGQAKEIIARCKDIPVYTADFNVLAQLTGFQLTRGVLCAMHRPKLPTVEEVCAGARRIAVLENVMNPTNVGAIFRSAAALNMDAVLLTPACSNPLYRRAIRVSMGTVFQIPWTYIGDEISQWPRPGMGRMKELGFQTVAMALKPDSINIDDPLLAAQEKLAVVLGTEGDGLSPDTLADCDYTVCIPMSHGVDSLNVAAASAIAFWQLGTKSSAAANNSDNCGPQSLLTP
ncbi:MAG: RNA methyltransferase [Lachnospiraceae bacterium]|nr:RNA methyltransferase [Lachnospiraceae bacterium]